MIYLFSAREKHDVLSIGWSLYCCEAVDQRVVRERPLLVGVDLPVVDRPVTGPKIDAGHDRQSNEKRSSSQLLGQ